MDALIISNFLLWGVLLCLVLVILALSRQIGVLYERVAPMGALTMDRGPAVGEAAPRFDINDLLGRPVAVGGGGAQSQLLFFLSPSCPVCKKLLPILKSVAGTEHAWLRIVLASDGEMPEHLAFYRQAGLERFPYLLSTELGMKFQISKLPYAVLIDESGTIRAKGLVNSREQLESLFTAKELGVASVQEFLATGATLTRPAFRARRTAMHWLDKLGSAPRAPSPTPPRGAACSTASAACSSAPPSSCRCCRWRARRPPPPRSRRPTRPPATTGATARSTASCVPAAAAA